jgi:hypothetical protein
LLNRIFGCHFAHSTSKLPTVEPLLLFWRKGWDLNPRTAFTVGGFQDRCHQPLGHPSVSYHAIESIKFWKACAMSRQHAQDDLSAVPKQLEISFPATATTLRNASIAW